MKTHPAPAAMSGHHPDGSSVQRHSAGPAYPYVIIGVGDGAGVMTPDGSVLRAYPRNPRTRKGRMAAWADARRIAQSCANLRALAQEK